jgi:hypothetical protein
MTALLAALVCSATPVPTRPALDFRIASGIPHGINGLHRGFAGCRIRTVRLTIKVMSLNSIRHSKLGLVLQIVAYTALAVVFLVLGLVEHRWFLLVTAVFGVGAIVTSAILLRSKGRTGDTDRRS